MEQKRTHTNSLTEETIEQLRKNPNVMSVSRSTVRFTPEFKARFYEQRQSGISTNAIFRSAGLDPDVLGQSRIDGFRYTIMKSHRQSDDKPKPDNDNARSAGKDELSPEAKIRQLEHELAYVRQEVEFLKKLQMANMEARRSWELKHRQK